VDEVVRLTQVTKIYPQGEQQVNALKDVSLTVRRGDFLAIMGPSGSGKSTFMNLIGCLDTPTAGEYWLNGTSVKELSDDELARVRNREIGFVFQTFNLLPRATSLHNVELPLIYAGVRGRERRELAREKLELVGLGHRMSHKPPELSGGQRQRVAIARALVNNPALLLADEPTGNLDQDSGQEILQLLHSLNEQRRLTIVMVTHDLSIARMAHRFVRLANKALHIETDPCP